MPRGHFMSLRRASPFAALTLLAVFVSSLPAPAEAQTIALKPGATPGKEVHVDHVRDYAYCEIAPVLGSGANMVAQFYNTTGTKGAAGGCPPDKFAAIDPRQLAADVKGESVYINPTPQTARRHWVMDEIWVYKAGETTNFLGVDATWMASMSPQQMKDAVAAPYEGAEIHRQSQYLYKKGSTVFLMRSTDGKTYVMQSYATEVDKNLTFAQLPQLGSKLKLPTGWKFEAVALKKDLTVDPRRSGGVAHVTRDDLHNVYEGCGFDATCNYTP